jgi:hypothetical protein
MPTDAERWRFLADHGLTLHTDGGDYGYMIHWCRTAGPGQPPKFFPVSNGKTAEKAIDRAMVRYYRKHGRPLAESPTADGIGTAILEVRGWVS